ncbi:MAG: hypothetical protein SP4CHLAM5_02090 [Chlamydiia bacterium]|nr:hypothetical protein [Chlamydiia bacterium]MCH9618083.1 hypothetical protein [Chlamydiia bacterium]MCH9624197.1 hypothetical protein [Chlamydiia bacterium]
MEHTSRQAIKVSVYDDEALKEHASNGLFFSYDENQVDNYKTHMKHHHDRIVALKKEINPWGVFFDRLLCRISDQSLETIAHIKYRQKLKRQCKRKIKLLTGTARKWGAEATLYRKTILRKSPGTSSISMDLVKVVLPKETEKEEQR